MSWGGISISSSVTYSDSSASTLKSHNVNLLSSLHTASTESSLGSNWRDVIALVCHLILVMLSNSKLAPLDPPFGSIRRSQILNSPLSSPDASKNFDWVFQEITFTSQSWATKDFWGLYYVALKSHNLIVWSVEQDASTLSWEGCHWISSTEPLCPYSPTVVSLTKLLQFSSAA